MLSKVLSKCKPAFQIRKGGFSSLKKVTAELFNVQQNSEAQSKIASYDPLQPIKSHNVVLKNDQKPHYQTTKLQNGVTILTESIVFPNVIDLGILLNVGVRDETFDTSGSLFALKSTYHQTILDVDKKKSKILHTAGGELEMEYDQENTYFKAHCLAHHVNDILSAMIDSAIKPITSTAAGLTIEKVQQHVALLEQMSADTEDLNDKIMKSAFGREGLGMPLGGIKENLLNLSENTLQRFQRENITPDKVYIAAAGIEDHDEFVRLVESKLSSLQGFGANITSKTRKPSQYTGGESRTETGSPEATLGLAFQSVPWNNQDIFAFQVLNTLMGSSASFSTGGPGKGMHSRATKNLLNRLSFVDAANAVCTNFTDSGIFGLILSGPSSNTNDLLRAIINEIKGLAKPIPPIELQRAKNITKSNILMALERQKDRLEESVKNIKTFGELKFDQYCDNVDKVTSYQVNSVVAQMLSKPLTLVAEGDGVTKLPSYDKIQNMVKL